MHLVTRKGFSEKLSRIQQYFPPAEVESLKMDTKRIQDYYRINRIFYSLFLPSKDYIYVGISRDGRFKHDDLLEAARTVARYIVQSQAHTVLELATGRGAN